MENENQPKKRENMRRLSALESIELFQYLTERRLELLKAEPTADKIAADASAALKIPVSASSIRALCEHKKLAISFRRGPGRQKAQTDCAVLDLLETVERRVAILESSVAELFILRGGRA